MEDRYRQRSPNCGDRRKPHRRRARRTLLRSLAEASLDRLTHYFELRLDALSLQAAEFVARFVLAELKTVGDDLTAFGRQLMQIETAGRNSAPATKQAVADDSTRDAESQQTMAMVQAKLCELVAAVDGRLQSIFLDGQGGLFQVVMQGGRPRAQLSAKIQEVARNAVQDLWTNSGNLRNAFSGREGNSTSESKLRAAIDAATPAALAHGGGRRVLAVVPRGTDALSKASELSQTAGVGISAVEGSDGNLTLCVEAERLSLAHLALSLIERRRDSVEFAKRVQSRSDIAWCPLLEVPLELADEPSFGLTTVSMAMDPAVRQTEVI